MKHNRQYTQHMRAVFYVAVVTCAILGALVAPRVAEATPPSPTALRWTPASQKEVTLSVQPLQPADVTNGLFFTPEQLQSLPRIIASHPRARATWNAMVTRVRGKLTAGTLASSSRPYVYGLYESLPDLSFVYLLTQDQQVGAVLRAAVLDAVNRPLEFWIHTELRRFNPAAPKGSLETAHLAEGVALALCWASNLFSADEEWAIRQALRTKGLEPLLRWLETPRRNNWLAVLATGAYITAKALQDSEAMAQTQKHIEDYLQLVEDDGSYGEQIGYFEYAVKSVAPGLLAMGAQAARELVANTGLRHSLEWMVYYYGFVANLRGGFDAGRLNFGDDDFTGRPSITVAYLLSYLFNDGLGPWLVDKYYDSNAGGDWLTLALFGVFHDRQVPPSDPVAAGLSTMQVFANGVGVIRSGWEPNSVVLGLRSGAGSRTNYTHDRPDRNSLVLFAGGEYLLVTPGRASYRSPLRQSWDLKTSSHNTITFADADQYKTPVAHIYAHWSGDLVDYMVSDAAPAYANNPEHVRRHVVYVRDPGYFLIWDEVKARDSSVVNWHAHLNNNDGKGTLRPLGEAQWLFVRPRAALQLQVLSSVDTTSSVTDGIMHTGYSYYPGDPNEGRPGSSIKLRVDTKDPAADVSFFAVLAPVTDLWAHMRRMQAGKTMQVAERTTDATGTKLCIKHGEYSDWLVFPVASGHPDAPGAAAGDIVLIRQTGGRTIQSALLSPSRGLFADDQVESD